MDAVLEIDRLERPPGRRRGARPDEREIAALQQAVGRGQAGDRFGIADARQRDADIEDVAVVDDLGRQRQLAAGPALRDRTAEDEAVVRVIARIADAVVLAVEPAQRDRGVLGDRLGHERVDAGGAEARRGQLERAAGLVEIGFACDEVDRRTGTVDGQDPRRARADRFKTVDRDLLLQDRVAQGVDVEDGQPVLLQLDELLAATGQAADREVVRHFAARALDEHPRDQFERLRGRARRLAVQVLAGRDGDRRRRGQDGLAPGARAGDDDLVEFVAGLLRLGLDADRGRRIGLRYLRRGDGTGRKHGGAAIERHQPQAGCSGDAAKPVGDREIAADRDDPPTARGILGRDDLDTGLARERDDAARRRLCRDVEAAGLSKGGGGRRDDQGAGQHQTCIQL